MSCLLSCVLRDASKNLVFAQSPCKTPYTDLPGGTSFQRTLQEAWFCMTPLVCAQCICLTCLVSSSFTYLTYTPCTSQRQHYLCGHFGVYFLLFGNSGKGGSIQGRLGQGLSGPISRDTAILSLRYPISRDTFSGRLALPQNGAMHPPLGTQFYIGTSVRYPVLQRIAR